MKILHVPREARKFFFDGIKKTRFFIEKNMFFFGKKYFFCRRSFHSGSPRHFGKFGFALQKKFSLPSARSAEKNFLPSKKTCFFLFFLKKTVFFVFFKKNMFFIILGRRRRRKKYVKNTYKSVLNFLERLRSYLAVVSP